MNNQMVYMFMIITIIGVIIVILFHITIVDCPIAHGLSIAAMTFLREVSRYFDQLP